MVLVVRRQLVLLLQICLFLLHSRPSAGSLLSFRRSIAKIHVLDRYRLGIFPRKKKAKFLLQRLMKKDDSSSCNKNNNSQDEDDEISRGFNDLRGGGRRAKQQPAKRQARFFQKRNDASRTKSPSSGVGSNKKTKKEDTPSSFATSLSTLPRKVLREHPIALIFSIATLILAFIFRHVWTPYLNSQFLQDKTMSLLQNLRPDDDTFSLLPLVLYACGMAGWEFLGLSTIPLETAAGHVLGFSSAAMASLTGKLVGASACYFLGGRYLVPPERLQSNKALQVLLESSSNNEEKRMMWTTALLLKFSVFPEVLKNVGSAALQVPFVTFLCATLLQGGTFTLVWSYLGSATAAATSSSVSTHQRPILAACVVIGFVLSPLNLAWWMRSIRRQKEKTVSSLPFLDSPWCLVVLWILTVGCTLGVTWD